MAGQKSLNQNFNAMPFPKEIIYVFRTSALHYLTPYLKMVYSSDEVQEIIKTAWRYKRDNYKDVSDDEFFLWYFEHKLNRRLDHPTMERMLRVAFKNELERTKHKNI